MFLDLALNAFFYLKTKKLIIRKILVFTGPLFLYFQKHSFDSMSFESLQAQLIFDQKNEFLEKPEKFIEKPPYETIFIKFKGSEDFEAKLNDFILRLKVKTRSVKISREDSKEHYFIKIYLTEDDSNHHEVFPLSNYHTNTEIAFLTRSLFKTKLSFRFSDLFYKPFENSIHLTVKNNLQTTLKICNLIRYFSNLYSHFYGLYHYVPLTKKFIKAESLAIFIFYVISITAFNLKLQFNLISTILVGISFVLTPLTCLFAVNLNQKPVLMFMFLAINIKFAFVYALICYAIELIKELKKIKK
jgi:hypothetical protein